MNRTQLLKKKKKKKKKAFIHCYFAQNSLKFVSSVQKLFKFLQNQPNLASYISLAKIT